MRLTYTLGLIRFSNCAGLSRLINNQNTKDGHNPPPPPPTHTHTRTLKGNNKGQQNLVTASCVYLLEFGQTVLFLKKIHFCHKNSVVSEQNQQSGRLRSTCASDQRYRRVLFCKLSVRCTANTLISVGGCWFCQGHSEYARMYHISGAVRLDQRIFIPELFLGGS